jgi:hypothetical protein
VPTRLIGSNPSENAKMTRLQNITLHLGALAISARKGQWRKLPFYLTGIRRMICPAPARNPA